MYKRFLGLSPMEWAIMILGVSGISCYYFLFPSTWWKILITGYGIGLTFETSTDPLFEYHAQLRDKHCIGKTDINFIFPIGWLGIYGFSAYLAETFLPFHIMLNYVIGGILIGNICEFAYFKSKCWTYNYSASWIGTFKPFWPKITIAGVPVMVVFGYGTIGLVIYALCHIIH